MQNTKERVQDVGMEGLFCMHATACIKLATQCPNLGQLQGQAG